jgi:hypothetical protein
VLEHATAEDVGHCNGATQFPTLAPVSTSYTPLPVHTRPPAVPLFRLSAGEAAKVKGTGHRDIPHRLNAEERPVYESAKRKVGCVGGGGKMARGWPAVNRD